MHLFCGELLPCPPLGPRNSSSPTSFSIACRPQNVEWGPGAGRGRGRRPLPYHQPLTIQLDASTRDRPLNSALRPGPGWSAVTRGCVLGRAARARAAVPSAPLRLSPARATAVPASAMTHLFIFSCVPSEPAALSAGQLSVWGQPARRPPALRTGRGGWGGHPCLSPAPGGLPTKGGQWDRGPGAPGPGTCAAGLWAAPGAASGIPGLRAEGAGSAAVPVPADGRRPFTAQPGGRAEGPTPSGGRGFRLERPLLPASPAAQTTRSFISSEPVEAGGDEEQRQRG